MTKQRELKWNEISEEERLANCLWSDLSTDQRKKEMSEIAKREGRKSPSEQTLLPDNERKHVSKLGGVAKSGKEGK